MRGKSKASRHRVAGEREHREKPIISIGYAFLAIKKGMTKEDSLKLDDEATKAGHTAHLVMPRSESKGIYAHLARQKGADEHL